MKLFKKFILRLKKKRRIRLHNAKVRAALSCDSVTLMERQPDGKWRAVNREFMLKMRKVVDDHFDTEEKYEKYLKDTNNLPEHKGLVGTKKSGGSYFIFNKVKKETYKEKCLYDGSLETLYFIDLKTADKYKAIARKGYGKKSCSVIDTKKMYYPKCLSGFYGVKHVFNKTSSGDLLPMTIHTYLGGLSVLWGKFYWKRIITGETFQMARFLN